MNDNNLVNLLEIFLTVQVSKELPRQGFLYAGFKRNEADSVAAHSFSVALFSYLFAKELESSGWDVDPNKALKLALVHDLGESITGDIGTYAKDLARDVFEKVEKRAFLLLIRNASNKKELEGFLSEYQKLESIEAQIVKFADALDAFVQGFNTPSSDIDDLKKTVNFIAKNKLKERKLTDILNRAIELIYQKKVSVFKGHYNKDEIQEKL